MFAKKRRQASVIRRLALALRYLLVVAVTPSAAVVAHFEANNSPWVGIPITGDYGDSQGWQEYPTDEDFPFVLDRNPGDTDGGSISLKFFPTDYPTLVTVGVNGNPLGKYVKAPYCDKIEINVPEGIFKRGSNKLHISQTTVDGKTPLYGEGFDSMDMRFGHASDENDAVRVGNGVRRQPEEYKLSGPAGVIPASGPGQPSASILDEEGDYLILTHSLFAAALAPLVSLRTGDDFTVRLITTEQIYEAFPPPGGNYAASVKSFIEYAFENWTLKPKYVLLVGAWSKVNPEVRFFPAYYYDEPTPRSQVTGEPCDDWFVDIQGNDFIPDIPIGRIPAWDDDQVTDYVSKLVYYEEHLGQTWGNNTTTIVNDIDAWDDGYHSPEKIEEYHQQLYSFAAEIDAGLTPAFNTEELRASDYGTPYARFSALKNRLDTGRGILFPLGFNYHEILRKFLNDEGTGETGDLTNTGKYPIIISSGCHVNGWSTGGLTETLGLGTDLTLASAKGCIVFIGSSGQVTAPEMFLLQKYVAEDLGRGEATRMGDIYLSTKRRILSSGYNNEYFGNKTVYYPMQFTGDPAAGIMGDRDNLPQVLPGWPQYTSESANGAVSADITPALTTGNNGGGIYIPETPGEGPLDVVASDRFDVYSWSYQGMKYFSKGVPPFNPADILADIDNNGALDIVSLHTSIGALAVFDNGGDILPGFPAYIPNLINYAPAVGDMNGDGYLDILCVGGSGADQLYAVDYTGQVLVGWPKQAPTNFYFGQDPSVGDVDADGELEAVFTYNGSGGGAGKLVIAGNSGTVETMVLPNNIDPGRAVLADLDGDPDLEIVIGCKKLALDETIKNLLLLDRALGAYHIEWQVDVGGDIEFPPCVGEFRSQETGKEIILTTAALGAFSGTLKCIHANNGEVIYSRALPADPVSAATVADICGDPGGSGYEVLVGLPSKLAAYRAWYTMEEAPDWNGSLEDDVTTPLVTDLDGDGNCDIICSDAEGVYAFTTNYPYAGLENFDWVRDGHDNLNMGLWDITAPTGVQCEDKPDDQGGTLLLSWTPSVDDGVRSTRVTSYEIYRSYTPFAPPGRANGPLAADEYRKRVAASYREAAANNGTVFVKVSNATVSPGVPGSGGFDDYYELVDTVPAGTYYYEDDGLENLSTYKYYLVATDGTRHSQRSIIAEAVPHDNIAPAPASNFDYVLREEPLAVLLSWTLSTDDPYYIEGPPPPPGPNGHVSAVNPSAPSAIGAGTGTSATVAGGITPFIGATTGSMPSYPGDVGGVVGEKQGEAAKTKFAEGLWAYKMKTRTARPRTATAGSAKTAGGANDVDHYLITKTTDHGSPSCFCVTAGVSEYADVDVSLGHYYDYILQAVDSENYSEECTVHVDLNMVLAGRLAGTTIGAITPGNTSADLPGGGSVAAVNGMGEANLENGLYGGERIVSCSSDRATGITTFTIKLAGSADVGLCIYDLAGRKVDVVLTGTTLTGQENVTWKPTVPNGVYIYKLKAGSYEYMGKVVVAR